MLFLYCSILPNCNSRFDADNTDSHSRQPDKESDIGAYYDLSGRKVSRAEAKKGIYIRNGKKYVIK